MDFNFQFGIGMACLFLKYNLQTIFLFFYQWQSWNSKTSCVNKILHPYLYARSLYNYESLCTCVLVIGVAF